MNLCLGKLILKLLARIGQWYGNVSEFTGFHRCLSVNRGRLGGGGGNPLPQVGLGTGPVTGLRGAPSGRRASACYAASGMPLPVMQEHFLVQNLSW